MDGTTRKKGLCLVTIFTISLAFWKRFMYNMEGKIYIPQLNGKNRKEDIS